MTEMVIGDQTLEVESCGHGRTQFWIVRRPRREAIGIVEPRDGGLFAPYSAGRALPHAASIEAAAEALLEHDVALNHRRDSSPASSASSPQRAGDAAAVTGALLPVTAAQPAAGESGPSSIGERN
jgi:hypothetical protein